MLIVAADGSATATLQRTGVDTVGVPVKTEPDARTGTCVVPLEIDPNRPRWDAEYAAHVRPEPEPCDHGDDTREEADHATAQTTVDRAEALALLDLIEDGRPGH
jgi:hypothetical protein